MYIYSIYIYFLYSVYTIPKIIYVYIIPNRYIKYPQNFVYTSLYKTKIFIQKINDNPRNPLLITLFIMFMAIKLGEMSHI